MKTDARVRYTRKCIKDSFIQLLRKKSLDKITVKSICDAAEINRTTFYKYYMDPYDLMEQLEEDILRELLQKIEVSNSKDLEDILITVLNEVIENRELYDILFYKQDGHAFNDKLILLCYQVRQPELLSKIPAASVIEKEWFYYYLIQGSSSILDCWIREGMKEDIRKVAGFICKMYYRLLGERK